MNKISNIIEVLRQADNLGLAKEVDKFDIRLAQILPNNNPVQQQQFMMLLQQIQLLNRELNELKNAMQEMQRQQSSNTPTLYTPPEGVEIGVRAL